MTIITTFNLPQFLVNAYGLLDPKRITSVGDGVIIRVDDKRDTDVYAGFCAILVRFYEDGAGSLDLFNAPINRNVEIMVESNGGSITRTPYGKSISIPLAPDSAELVWRLARVISRVIVIGLDQPRYPDRNWKWIVPRTVASLESLAERLEAFDHLQRALRTGGPRSVDAVAPHTTLGTEQSS